MHRKNKPWEPQVFLELNQEIGLLKDMKNGQKHRKWKSISQILARQGWNRSHVECRSKWVNCLAPGINNKEWTDGELQLLYALYEKYDSRWSSIQKELPNRTQTKIKNHFYSVLRGITRFVLKYFQEAPGSETKIANRINPKVLQLMYKGVDQFSFFGDTISKAIASMNFRFSKHTFKKIIQNDLTKFQKLSKQVLVLANRLEDSSGQPSLELSEDVQVSIKNQNLGQSEQQVKKQEGEANLKQEIPQQPPEPMCFNNTYAYFENPYMFSPAGQFALIPVLYQPTRSGQLFKKMDCFMLNNSY